MNVVIYARYSSHNQTEQSIEGQLKECYSYCKQNNYNVIEEYIDEALSGTTDNRPSFLRMIEDSNKHTFQYVIVYQFDRFSRNRYDAVKYKHKLQKNGVTVLSVKEYLDNGPNRVLMESILEGMAEYYSNELSNKVRRGMDLNAEKCLSTGGNIALGYKVGKDRKFQIDPDKAYIVKTIFEMYASGKTVKEITDHLNSLGLKTSRGVAFNKNSLHTILKNKRYIGVYTYKGKETPNGMPRIISDELFNKVADIMNKNRKAPARAKAKIDYLLTTKLFCGKCKEMMTGYSATGKQGKTYRYYVCNGKKIKKCDKKMVDKDYIENIVISECRRLLTDENINKIADEVVAICESEKDTSNLKHLKKLLSESKRKHENTICAIMESDIQSVRKALGEKIPVLEKEIEELEKQISMEESNLPSLSLLEVKFFLNKLKKGDINDIKYRKVLISIFVNKIYLYDDRVTITYNSGDKPVTINDTLLSEIEKRDEEVKNLFLDGYGPPILYLHKCCSYRCLWGFCF